MDDHQGGVYFIMKYLKKPVRSLFHAVGYEISPYVRPSDSFNALYPQCWHDAGFVYDIFGHFLYQNVTDLVNYGGLKGQSIRDYGRRHTDEIATIINRVKPGQRVIDVGANIGLYTLLLAKLVGPQGGVIAFEPGPLSFSLLSLNTLLNGYKNVELVNKGVTVATRSEYYYSDRTTESGSTVTISDPEFGHPRERIPIETVSLDDYFSGTDRKIDFIKIDIEGGEYSALKGMTGVLTSNPDIWLTIEYAPYLPLWKDVDLLEFLSFVRSYNFQICDLTRKSGDEPVSDQYLIETYPKHQIGKYANLLLRRL
jgi:FkbM family methyltransferase